MSLPPQSPLLAQRIRRGLTLAVRRRARLIFSGGVPAGTAVTEAGQMLMHARTCHAEELDALRHSPFLEEGSAKRMRTPCAPWPSCGKPSPRPATSMWSPTSSTSCERARPFDARSTIPCRHSCAFGVLPCHPVACRADRRRNAAPSRAADQQHSRWTPSS